MLDQDGLSDQSAPRVTPSMVVSETYVEHPVFSEVRDEIVEFIDDLDLDHPSICVLGHARTGKTTLCEKIYGLYPREIDAVVCDDPIDGRTVADRIPVVIAEVPEGPTVKSLGHQILLALGDPHWNRGDKANVTNRIDYYLKRCQTRAILLDEAHNIVDASGTAAMEGIADWLKIRYNKTRVLQILIGLPRTELIFKNNEQLRGRYGTPLLLSPYTWGQDSHGDDNFIGLLSAFQERLPIPSIIDFCDELNAKRFYYASSGVIGLLKKLLRWAVWIATRRGASGAIDFPILARAYMKSVWKEYDGKPINPFEAAYKGEMPPSLKSDSLTGIARKTRRRMKADAIEMLTKR